MLAFTFADNPTTLLPMVSGDWSGDDIVITSDSADAAHELYIDLDDVTNAGTGPGYVTATITAKVNGSVTDTYTLYNFNSIFYTASNDTNGSVVNQVFVSTPYETSLLGQEVAPTGLSTNWLVANTSFFNTPNPVLVDINNADALTVEGGVLDPAAVTGISTIAGEFETPTLAPDATTGASITLVSGVDIETNGDDPVVAYTLGLVSTAGSVRIVDDLITQGDLAITAHTDITVTSTGVSYGGDISLLAINGDVAITSIDGDALLHAMAGEVSVESECGEVVIDRICADGEITVIAPQGVNVVTELRSENGGVTITADAGPVTIAGDIFTKTDVLLTAAQSVTLEGLIETAATDVLVATSSGDINLSVGSLIHARAGGIVLQTKAGAAAIDRLTAFGAIAVTAPQGVTVATELRSENAGVTITADAGPVQLIDVFAKQDVALSAAGAIELNGLLQTTEGGISATTTSGAIVLRGAELHALAGEVSLRALKEGIEQRVGGVLTGASVLRPGSTPVTLPPSVPVVTLVVAPPQAGGVAATAAARVGRRTGPLTGVDEWYLEGIDILDPGSGYAINENPLITVTGIDGALGRGAGASWGDFIVAEQGVTIEAGGDITLLGVVRSNAADITVKSDSGAVNTAAGASLHAVVGTVKATAVTGPVTVVGQIDAGTDVFVSAHQDFSAEAVVNAGRDVSLTSDVGSVSVSDVAAGRAITIQGLAGVQLADVAVGGQITSAEGDINVSSIAGSVEIAAAINAVAGSVVIEAHQDIQQAVGTGLVGLTLRNGGLVVSDGVPEVNVTIDPPAGGGEAARAVVELEDLGPVDPPADQPRFWRISRIILTNPGNGYALNESPPVTITGMPNAAATAIGPGQSQALAAGKDFQFTAGNDIELVSTVRSNAGNVSIASIDGTINLSTGGQLVHAVEGDIALEARAGSLQVQRLVAGGDIAIAGALGIESLDSIVGNAVAVSSSAGSVGLNTVSASEDVLVEMLGNARFTGDVFTSKGKISIESTAGNVVITNQMVAEDGDVTISVLNGDLKHVPEFPPAGGYTAPIIQAGKAIDVTVRGIDPVSNRSAELWSLVAGTSLTVETLGSLAIRSEQTATTGNITFRTQNGSIDFSRSNVHAVDGSIRIDSHGSVVQDSQDGIVFIDVVSAGQEAADNAPTVDVVVDPPAAPNGRAASAIAITSIIGYQVAGGGIVLVPGFGTVIVPADATPVWGVSSIRIVDAGSGYVPGETPRVTISGLAGAAAQAVGPASLPFNLVAKNDIDVVAGDDISFASVVRSTAGRITIQSVDGDVDLSASTQLVHTLVGDIAISALAGKIQYNDIVAGGDLSLQSFAPLAINRPLVLNGGGVTLASAGGDIAVQADVLAVDQLSLSAKTGIDQTGGTIKATDLLAENSTPTPITLDRAGNDVDRFSAFNIGAITYNDANSFRVGLQTSGPMGVELVGGAVALTATDTIRVVAGIEAGTLQMAADTVELVTTKATDNPNGPFGGTFRDMIEISNANENRASEHVMVFDEPGYPISEITVSRTLPAITRAVTIDGETADGGRLGISGRAGVPSGVYLGAGSAGSRIAGTAVYGFTTGSAILVESSDNTIDDMFLGLRADGSAAPANRVGVNLSGDRAYNNVIGSDYVFDPLFANRFAGQTDAAIVVQRGASNNLIAGNLIGGDGLAANRNGIRIDGGSGNRIGTPDQVTPDLQPTESNRIVGNSHYGIEIRNVRGRTTRIENNVVSGNATQAGSGTHGIGVLNSAFVQIGGGSELSRNQVFANLGGSGIHLSGSNNIRIQGNVIGSDGYHLSANAHNDDAFANRPDLGNGMHGIHVFGRSRDVEIDGNRVVDNGGSGVAVATGSANVVLTNNEIGVWVHPVTGNVHAAGNTADGVTITAANGNTVGSGNLIGFNRGSGVRVENSVAVGLATGNRVTGSDIFSNLGHGVHVAGSSRQTIGGLAGDGNVVKENSLDGVRIETDPRIRASAAPRGNVVAGNFLGTNPNEEIDSSWGNRAGVAVMNGVENVLSGNVVMNNRESGIEVSGGSGNTVGGLVASAGNFVGYNLGDGVFVHDQASTELPVGVLGTTITNGGAGYAASRTTVIFSAPAAPGGVAARGVAVISAAGRVTGIQLTSKGSGYAVGETVTVTIFDPRATVQATATVRLGAVEAVSQVSRGHVISGNEIEANNGAGIYVKGDRTTEVQVGQGFDSRTGRGLANTISYQGVGVLVEAARRVSVQGNVYSDNGTPVMMMNGANAIPGAHLIDVIELKSSAWGRGQTRVTGTVVNGGAFQEYWVDVYATPYYDMAYDGNGDGSGHQMRTFLGRTLITTDATGRAVLSLTVSQSMGLGDHLSVMLTSNRHEDGSTVGIWHATKPHNVDLSSSPTTGSSTVTPDSSGGTATPPRAPVPPRG